MARGAGTTVTVDGHTLTLTNPDKVMYPATGTTKADVLAYYRAVAPWFTAHNGRRPATRKRWVNGVGTADKPGAVFFSKDLDSGTPDWVATTVLAHRGHDSVYPLVDDESTLAWLAQIAALEIHVPQWRVGPRGAHRNPDRLVLDLDPGEGAGLPECVRVAHLCREILSGMGLACVPVTSGSKGIHLYAALDGRTTAEQATVVARELARSLEADHPDLVVSEMKRALRGGKVFLDWSQNNGNKTTVAPYSLRGRLRPTVAAPRSWEELTPQLRHLEYGEVLDRLRGLGDPMAPLLPAGESTPERLGDAPPQAPSPGHAEPPVASSGENPPRIQPMLATLGTEADVSAGEWAYETKWDGYRALAQVAGGAVAYRSRNANDLTATYPELQELGTLLGGRSAVLDGEIVAVDPSGRSDFGLLQNRGDLAAGIRTHYMIFDVLHLDGRSLLRLPYSERRTILEGLGIEGRHVHVPPTFGTDRELALATSRELRLEGVIAKTVDGVYRPGARARTWIKIKNLRAQEVVIVGWTPGAGRRAGQVGSLLLAVTDGDRLSYAGKVGTGFTERSLAEIGRRLAEIERPTPPLEGVPRVDARDAHWTEPVLVGEVAYGEWTSAGRLRHPAWRGWRPDKRPGEVRRADG